MKELKDCKRDERARESNEGAVKTASIRHVWDYFDAGEVECSQDPEAKEMMNTIKAFVKQKCSGIAEGLSQEENLPKALRMRSSSLDGAPLFIRRVNCDERCALWC